MPNPTKELLPVEEVDREAAADGALARLVGSGPYPSCPPQVWMVAAVKPIRMGALDDHPDVQAFARHRLAARLEGKREAYEDAAKVAESPGFIEARDTEWDAGVNYAKRFIADAIRAALEAMLPTSSEGTDT
jgi:hypothetical protein